MKKFLMPLAMAFFFVGSMQAATIGTQGFADFGVPLAGGSASGNINTSTAFTVGNLTSTIAETGVFAGFGPDFFGPVTFDTTVANSLTFGDAAFGTFTSTAFTTISNTPGAVDFYVLGNFVTGTSTNSGGLGGPASFTIGFTQTPAVDGGISDSATLSIPPAPLPGVPEPTTMVLMGSALIGLAMVRRRKA